MKALTILMIWTLFVLIIGAISVIVMNRAFIMNRKKGERMNTIEKIRAEIDVIEINGQVDEHTAFIRTGEHVKQMALDIIDKYAEQEPCDDAISREETLTAFADYVGGGMSMDDYDALWNIVAKMPSVNPQEQKTGHWIIIDDCEQFIAKCSKCGRIEDSRMISKYPYCHCGAKMESDG